MVRTQESANWLILMQFGAEEGTNARNKPCFTGVCFCALHA